MRLKDLPADEILERVLESDKLREKFEAAVQEYEMGYISDILDCFGTRCADYSIGIYNRNYFYCTDASEFVCRAREMADMYGASEKTLKVLARAEKLRGTNLFEHYADKLAECVESDLCEYARAIEDLSYDIDCRNATPTLLDYCRWFAECAIGDEMIGEDGERVHQAA